MRRSCVLITAIAIVVSSAVPAVGVAADVMPGSWTRMGQAKLRPWTMDFVDAKVGWAAGDGGALLKTTNAGKTWKAQKSGTKASIRSIDAVTTKVAYAVDQAGGVLKTSNGGTTWRRTVLKGKPALAAVTFTSSTRGYVCGAGSGKEASDGFIWVTTDGGKSWRKRQTRRGVPYRDVCASGSKYVWALGRQVDDNEVALVSYSKNGGVSWETVDFGVTYAGTIMNWGTKTVAVMGTTGAISRSVTGGRTWHRMPVPAQSVGWLMDGAYVSSTTIWAVGGNPLPPTRDARVYATTGTTGAWQGPLAQLTETYLVAMKVRDSRLAWAITSEGACYRYVKP